MFKMSTDEDIIAQAITRKEIGGLLKQAVIGPNEVVILIRNGKIEDVVSQTKLKSLGGGLANWATSKLGGGEDFQLLFVDTSPNELEFVVGKPEDMEDDDARLFGYTQMLSKDHENVNGTCTVRFQIDPENALNVINLMRGREEETDLVEKKGLFGRKKLIEKSIGKVLRKSDLEERIQNEFVSTIFAPQISQYDGAEFRGNLTLIRDMEAATSVEMRKTFDMWGLNLLRLYTVWEKGAFDELMRYKREVMITEQREDVDHETVLSEMRREHGKSKLDQEQSWALTFGEVEGEERVKTMRVDGDVLREGKTWDEATRQFRTRTAAEIDAERARRQTDVDMQRQETETATDAFEKVQAAKRERMKLDQDFKGQQMAVQTSSTERIMSEALKTGVADSDSLKEMMKQQTMQRMADREVEKVQALSEAEKARYDVETFKEAEDREREQQVKVMDQTAKIMEASKQDMPKTLVQSGSAAPSVTVPVISRPDSSEKIDGVCLKCGEEVKATWQVCPNCGTPQQSGQADE